MTARSRLSSLILICTLVPLLQSCDSNRKTPKNEAAESVPTMTELNNMAYQGLDGLEGPVVLSDGVWEGAPFQEGAETRPRVTFAGNFRIDGDLDGDGTEESAVLLNVYPGGTGELLYLCIVARSAGLPVNRVTAFIGDRVQIRSGKTIDNHVLLDVVEAGPDDPACCPGQIVTYGWTYTAEGALERSTLSETPLRLSLDLLGEHEWVLRFWDREEPAPENPAVTLSYNEERFVGSGGCNRYFASVSERISAGDILVGPVGSTQMACPDEDMKVEIRYLANLGNVTKFGFLLGRLALTYQAEGGIRTMLFEKRSSR